jgi:hypothetical protein
MPFTKVSPDVRKVFDEAVRGLTVLHYTPMAVSTQTVSGTNYNFAANAKVANGSDCPILIRIFRPLNGLARLCGTYALGLPGALGTFGPFRDTNETERTPINRRLRRCFRIARIFFLLISVFICVNPRNLWTILIRVIRIIRVAIYGAICVICG